MLRMGERGAIVREDKTIKRERERGGGGFVREDKMRKRERGGEGGLSERTK